MANTFFLLLFVKESMEKVKVSCVEFSSNSANKKERKRKYFQKLARNANLHYGVITGILTIYMYISNEFRISFSFLLKILNRNIRYNDITMRY